MSDHAPSEAVLRWEYVCKRMHDGSERLPAEAEFRCGVAKIKADALRDAASHLGSFEGPGGRSSAHDKAGRDIIRIIRERADQIEGEA